MNKMKLTRIMFGILLVLAIGLVSAHEHNLDETKQLIDSGISCDKLSNEQLESIGEYYMEQMHPGEAHKVMDEMMGGEGSESLRQMHIAMAKRLYCNDISGMVNYGMMGMMMGGFGKGTNYGGGMMANLGYDMMGYGMMGGYGYGLLSFIVEILVIIILVLLIIWLYQKITEKRR